MGDLATTATPPDEGAQRNALTFEAVAEISDLTRAVRRLIDPASDDPMGAGIKALMSRIEALSDAIAHIIEPGAVNLEEVAAMVRGPAEVAHG